MSNSRKVDANADAPAQIDRTIQLKNRLLGLALAGADGEAFEAAIEEYDHVVVGSVAALLAQQCARLTEKAARVAAHALAAEALGRVQAIGDNVPLPFRRKAG